MSRGGARHASTGESCEPEIQKPGRERSPSVPTPRAPTRISGNARRSFPTAGGSRVAGQSRAARSAMQAGERRCLCRTPHVGPAFHAFDQSGSHRILDDVASLLRETLIGAQSMVEEIDLPANPALPRHPPLPVRDHLFHRPVGRKTGQKVTVIRHRHEEMHPPCLRFDAPLERFREERPQFRPSELVLPARLAADGDEPDLTCRIDPERRIVGKGFSTSHAGMIDHVADGSRSQTARESERLARIPHAGRERPPGVPHLPDPQSKISTASQSALTATERSASVPYLCFSTKP